MNMSVRSKNIINVSAVCNSYLNIISKKPDLQKKKPSKALSNCHPGTLVVILDMMQNSTYISKSISICIVRSGYRYIIYE